MNTNDKFIIQRHRETYKKDSILLINLTVLGCVGLLALMLTFILIQFSVKPAAKGFSLNQNLQIIEPQPLERPAVEQAFLINWVSEMLQTAFSYNYTSQDQIPDKLKDYMDDKGIEAFKKLLQEDIKLSKVKEQEYIVALSMRSAPKIDGDGVINGRYAWKLTLEADIIMANAQQRDAKRTQMEVLVWRVPETEAPLGIRIIRFNIN